MLFREPEGLTDEVLQQEIELVGSMVLAAALSPGHMCDADIDRALGLPLSRSRQPLVASTQPTGEPPIARR